MLYMRSSCTTCPQVPSERLYLIWLGLLWLRLVQQAKQHETTAVNEFHEASNIHPMVQEFPSCGGTLEAHEYFNGRHQPEAP